MHETFPAVKSWVESALGKGRMFNEFFLPSYLFFAPVRRKQYNKRRYLITGTLPKYLSGGFVFMIYETFPSTLVIA